MKQMKRAAGLLLALVLVLSMAACGKKDGDGGDSQSGFQRGTIENGIYTNTFVGIGCQLSDDWTYYTDASYPVDVSGVKAYADDKDISDYARESVYYLSKLGVVGGIGNNTFAPKAITSAQQAAGYATATREQALAIAVRMVENLK